MRSFLSFSQAAKLDLYHLALTNATTDARIAESLSKFGLTKESLEEGKALFQATRKAYESNISLKRKQTVVYNHFKNKKEELKKLYSKHRKIAKIVFEENSNVYQRLDLSTKSETIYAVWIERLKSFYSLINADNEVREKLTKVLSSSDELDAALAAIPALEKARADYLLEKGASQNSTEAKNIAFAQMDEWMQQFFNLSRIAFRKQPQLMESFGLTVKNQGHEFGQQK